MEKKQTEKYLEIKKLAEHAGYADFKNKIQTILENILIGPHRKAPPYSNRSSNIGVSVEKGRFKKGDFAIECRKIHSANRFLLAV